MIWTHATFCYFVTAKGHTVFHKTHSPTKNGKMMFCLAIWRLPLSVARFAK